jgi:hypothetical protein
MLMNPSTQSQTKPHHKDYSYAIRHFTCSSYEHLKTKVFKILKLFLHRYCTCFDRYGHHQVLQIAVEISALLVSKFKPKYTLIYVPMGCGASYGMDNSSCHVVCNCYEFQQQFEAHDDDCIGRNM